MDDMKEPRAWNNLEDAAKWLTQETSKTWIGADILDFSFSDYKLIHRPGCYVMKSEHASFLRTRLPKDVPYGMYTEEYKELEHKRLFPMSRHAEEVLDEEIRRSRPSGRKALVHLYDDSNDRDRTATAPLFRHNIKDLIFHGKTSISRIAFPSDSGEGYHFCIAPLGDFLDVTMDMVGITRESLKKLLSDYKEKQRAPSPDAPVAKVEALSDTSPSGDDAEEQDTDDHDDTLAALFDPVPVEALGKMFPAGGKWKGWGDKAKENGLKDAAKVGRAMFNPYKAGLWFVRKGMEGWDNARLNRTLANNLPARSRDNKHLLTGGID